MPAPRWLSICWRGTHFCSRCVGTLALWTLWLGLAVALAVQLRIAFGRELSVPDFVLQRVEQRLAASGLGVTFGGASFDPQGHLLLRRVELGSRTFAEPLLLAEDLYLVFDPWSLPLGRLELERIEIVDARLQVPAMLSPSGRAEPLLAGLNARIEILPDRRLRITQLSTRLGSIPITARGELYRPAIDRDEPDRPSLLALGLKHYPTFARDIAAALAALPALEAPWLDLELTADPARLARVSARFSADAIDGPAALLPRLNQAVRLTAVRLNTAAVLRAPIVEPIHFSGRIDQVDAGARGSARDLRFTGSAPLPARGGTASNARPDGAWTLRLTAAELSAEGLTATTTDLAARLDRPDHLALELTTRLAGEAWTLSASGDPATRAGEFSFGGTLPYALVSWAAQRRGRDLGALLQFDIPPTVEAHVTLGPGARPIEASGRLGTEAVVARGVPLDATGARFAWRPGHLRFDDILLATGASRATGSYEMDTESLDFRFLLAGRLEPAAIDGWFRDWWSNFWTNFVFRPGQPPDASVDIAGRWKRPWETRVYVEADGRHATLRGTAFDRIRTRLFVRPEFVDVLEFIGDRPEGTVRGGFQRSWELAGGGTRWTTFDFTGRMDIDALAGIFPDIGPSIVAPFRLANVPHLHLRGRVAGPADDRDLPRLDITVDGEVDGLWLLYDFPLNGLVFSAHKLNDTLTVNDLLVGFAGGRASGDLELSGPAEATRLAFTLALSEARLGDAINTLEAWAARRRNLPPPTISRFQQRIAAGRLDLALSAEGPVDNAYAFNGGGNASVTGADFGEINLFGILSTLMRRTLLNFSTLELDTARANFDLAGNRLLFSDLTLTGPQAAIEAVGSYRLDQKELAMTAKVLPFNSSRGLLGSAMDTFLTPISNVLEVKLTGTLGDPSWAFSYGPTSFFRALIGADSGKPQLEKDSTSAPNPFAAPPLPATGTSIFTLPNDG